MRSLATAHFIHNKFPFSFNEMFIINISVVLPKRKGREDYVADLASNIKVQNPNNHVSWTVGFIRRLLNESVL